MFRFQYIKQIMITLILISLAGCLQNPCPNQNNFKGSLRLKICQAEQQKYGSKSVAADITRLTIKMDLKGSELTKTVETDYQGNDQEIEVSDIYPGEWQVTVTGIDRNGRAIFQGNAKADIQSGVKCDLQIDIKPAPAKLSVSLNTSQIAGFGDTVKTGNLYIYKANDQTTIPMKTNGLYLQVETAMPEGTVQIRVAVPNISKAVYISPYYTVNIQAGDLYTLNIAADGSVNIAGTIDSTPSTPTGLNAIYNNDTGTVSLSWDKVNESDLQGYRLYRTNNDGRYIMIHATDKDTTNYNDTVTSSVFFNNRLGYSVSSFDMGGNESFWSNPVYIQK